MKNLPVGAELFHADRQTVRRTDMIKLTVAFRNLANAPKNLRYAHTHSICVFCMDLRKNSYYFLIHP